jgi:signal peptidase I
MLSTQTLIRTLVVVLALPVVWFLAPLQLHGHTGYAVVSGVSMEPHFHDGDLVLIRERPSYHIGEVVAYRSPAYGAVLHRVKAVQPDGSYVFRGDNNARDDRPVRVQDLIGARWVRLPRAGAAMLWIREPWHEVIVVLIALLLGGLARLTPGGRRRHDATLAAPGEPLPRRARRVPASQALLVAAIALALSAGVWLIAFATPKTRSAENSHLYRETATLATTARVPRSSVYPEGRLRSGDAIFTRLVHAVAVGFDYRLSSASAPVHAGGTMRIDLALSADGHRLSTRTLATAPLTGPTGHIGTTLDVDALERTVRAVEAQASSVSRFGVTLAGVVAMKGHVGASPIASRYTPAISYTLDANRLLLADGVPHPFARDGSGIVNVANSFHLGFATVSVTTAQRLAAYGAVLGLLGLLAAFALGRTRNDEPSQIAWRYRDWLVPITQLPHTGSTITDVGDFMSLVQLADRHNKSILHLADDGEHTYLVKENGLLYRYTAHDAGATQRPLRASAPHLPGV